MNNEKTILIDLDGVLNTYTGNFVKDVIPPVKEGAKEFLQDLSKNFIIKIFTTRNKMQTVKWLISNNLDNFVEDITNVKELSYLYIDDRCINFDGDFKLLKRKIEKFKPWYN